MPPRKTTRPRRRSQPLLRRTPVIAALVGIVVAALVLAVFVSGDAGESPPGVEQTRAVRVDGAALPPLPRDGSDPAPGAVAPEVSGRSFDGTPRAISADGRPKLVVFLAHWCPHCQREVPVLAEWMHSTGGPTGVDVYAVATATDDSQPNYPPSAWLEREDWPVPTIADNSDSSVGTAFGVSSYPFFVALDADHNVVARTSGALGVDAVETLVDLAREGT